MKWSFRDAPTPPPADAITFTGDYPDYASALAACGGDRGYESEAAVSRYIRRFQEVSADVPGAIRKSAAQLIPFIAAFGLAEPADGIYEVFDLGGGYGAIYDQLRALFPARRIRWTVVELPALVARGADMGASEEKLFATEIPDRPYSVGIVSGALQCLPNPKAALDDLCRVRVPLLMVGRVPIAPFLGRDRLTVESVPASLFKATFPSWFFAPDWRERLGQFGETVMEWDSPGDLTALDGKPLNFKAFLLQR